MTYLGYFIPVFRQNGLDICSLFFNTSLFFKWPTADTLFLFAATSYLSVLSYTLYFPMGPPAKNFFLCSRLCGKKKKCV